MPVIDNTYFQDTMFSVPANIGEHISEQIKWDFGNVKVKTIFFVINKSGVKDWLKIERYNSSGELIDAPLMKIFNIGAGVPTGGSFEKPISMPIGWYFLAKYNSIANPKIREVVIRIEFTKS